MPPSVFFLSLALLLLAHIVPHQGGGDRFDSRQYTVQINDIRRSLRMADDSPPLLNGVLVTAKVRLREANFSAVTGVASEFLKFQTEFKNALIAAARSTGYEDTLQVSIENVTAGSIIVESTTWFIKSMTYDLPRKYAAILENNVSSVFAGLDYFSSLPAGDISTDSVTVAASLHHAKSSFDRLSWLVWLLVAVIAALLLTLFVWMCCGCPTFHWWGKKNVQDDMEDNYDPEKAYAQLVAEAQGYQRGRPSGRNSVDYGHEKVKMPDSLNSMPMDQQQDGRHFKLRSNDSADSIPDVETAAAAAAVGAAREAGTGSPMAARNFWKAISGPVLFTRSPISDITLLPHNVPHSTRVNHLPPPGNNRLPGSSILRSVSGPMQMFWFSPSQDPNSAGWESGEETGTPRRPRQGGNWPRFVSGSFSDIFFRGGSGDVAGAELSERDNPYMQRSSMASPSVSSSQMDTIELAVHNSSSVPAAPWPHQHGHHVHGDNAGEIVEERQRATGDSVRTVPVTAGSGDGSKPQRVLSVPLIRVDNEGQTRNS